MKDWYQVTVITSDLNCLSQGYEALDEEDAKRVANNNWDDIAVILVEPYYVTKARRIP